jgi:hypothetical protein
MNKRLALLFTLFFGMGVVLASCAGLETKPSEANFKAPVVKLDSIQVSYYEGFWYYGKATPELGKAPAGGGSSPISLDFVFTIANPNDFPVSYESSSFYLYFEDYELRVVNDSNPMWIPPGKTNTKVLNVTLTPYSTFAKFLLVSRDLAAQRGHKPWEKIEQWWNGLPNMSFPIDLKEGGFTFSADNVVKVVPVVTRYPSK